VLRSQASLYVIEMSTAPGCLPCGDLWAKLQAFRAHYGWQVRTIGAQEAMLRSGRSVSLGRQSGRLGATGH
jgi:hypothetical protein